MVDTLYSVLGNPNVLSEGTSQEVFSAEEIAAIQIVALNIEDIEDVAVNGPLWSTQAQTAASQADASKSAAQTAASNANASAVAASSSASAASTSATSAGAAATAASSSASAAGTSASDAANAAASVQDMVPAGGVTGQYLVKNSEDDYDAGWFTPTPTADNLRDMGDVDTGAQANNFVLYYDAVADKYKFRSPLAATTFAGMTDVNFASLQDLQVPTYDAASGKWLNKQMPLTTIPKKTRIEGPATHSFAALDLYGYTELNCLGGSIDFVFDDTVTTPAGQVLETLVNVLNSSATNKVNFKGANATGPKPIVGTPIVINKDTGVGGTPLTNAQNTAVAVNIPAGINVVAIIAYAVNPANTAAQSLSTGFTFNGVTQGWDQILDPAAAPNAPPRIYLAAVALGTLAAVLNTTFKPNWTDYGGNGNVNAYSAIIVPVVIDHQATRYENLLLERHNTASLTFDPVITTGPSMGNRVGLYFAFRRSNTGPTPIVASGLGVTQIAEGASGTSLNSSELRYCVAVKDAIPDHQETAHFNFGISQVYAGISLFLTPLAGSMLVVGSGKIINPSIAADGLLGIVYDANAQRVDIAA